MINNKSRNKLFFFLSRSLQEQKKNTQERDGHEEGNKEQKQHGKTEKK